MTDPAAVSLVMFADLRRLARDVDHRWGDEPADRTPKTDPALS